MAAVRFIVSKTPGWGRARTRDRAHRAAPQGAGSPRCRDCRTHTRRPRGEAPARRVRCRDIPPAKPRTTTADSARRPWLAGASPAADARGDCTTSGRLPRRICGEQKRRQRLIAPASHARRSALRRNATFASTKSRFEPKRATSCVQPASGLGLRCRAPGLGNVPSDQFSAAGLTGRAPPWTAAPSCSIKPRSSR
jgi:hypothetical protein